MADFFGFSHYGGMERRSHPDGAARVVDATAIEADPTEEYLTEATASPSIRDLIHVIGAPATRMLCARIGGMTRDIGPPNQLFVDAIGREAAEALRAYLGPGRIHIPRQSLSAKARWQLVWRLDDEGLTRHEIARRVDISVRQVYHILSQRPRRLPTSAKQSDLFAR
ncbi:helix-turn-helix domain-containing protein [Aurantimonas sp. C2-6-R+9]|uniref:helix-turn-helix domain-containing protein n=1 Tax=unclassified Aurantimonas TaxID=2638230 RepID=UPI002E16BC07|nr:MULTISPECIES: helix-turn-helix domain-containing protein [unclassified Aurantimonas]MEC5291992.1 helix-turn-helix domain-containing protein [Aurantimonas sp. C2-3-R2]MEC5382104.1 helix-turn-helix domain-containing protein [Aurantimonas sp. C2-6-R+9]MEC5413077.1 helix-turn-helix domain-containing protein [Aurantimonas sp. C2-4-R8]